MVDFQFMPLVNYTQQCSYNMYVQYGCNDVWRWHVTCRQTDRQTDFSYSCLLFIIHFIDFACRNICSRCDLKTQDLAIFHMFNIYACYNYAIVILTIILAISKTTAIHWSYSRTVLRVLMRLLQAYGGGEGAREYFSQSCSGAWLARSTLAFI